MNSHLKGLIITTLGVLFVVPDSLFVRLIEAEPMVTAFWRGMISGLIILFAVPIFQGLGGFSAILSTGWAGVIYTLFISSTAPAFVRRSPTQAWPMRSLSSLQRQSLPPFSAGSS